MNPQSFTTLSRPPSKDYIHYSPFPLQPHPLSNEFALDLVLGNLDPTIDVDGEGKASTKRVCVRDDPGLLRSHFKDADETECDGL